MLECRYEQLFPNEFRRTTATLLFPISTLKYLCVKGGVSLIDENIINYLVSGSRKIARITAAANEHAK